MNAMLQEQTTGWRPHVGKSQDWNCQGMEILGMVARGTMPIPFLTWSAN